MARWNNKRRGTRKGLRKVKQAAWMSDKWNQAKEYGTMASEKAKEYGMEKPKRRSRTIKRVMKKRSTQRRKAKKMNATVDSEDLGPMAAGGIAGGLLGGWKGAGAGVALGWGASKLLKKKKKD